MTIIIPEHLLPSLAQAVTVNVKSALYEDLGSLQPEADLTSRLIPAKEQAEAVIIARHHAVLCGVLWANEVCRQLDKSLKLYWMHKDGDAILPNQPFCLIKGSARSILTAERSILNFLQTLSATATLTRQYANKIACLPVAILDTRKTIPGLRMAQKYAVACGGGRNHRLGLYDAILMKENHIYGHHNLRHMLKRAEMMKNHQPDILLVVEVETLEELEIALHSGADRILLDNFTTADMVNAVAMRNSLDASTRQNVQKQKPKNSKSLEVSGNITLDNLVEIASTGIDFISVGALTKNIQAVDMSCLFIQSAKTAKTGAMCLF